jgi:hypothetical protein
MAPKRDGNEITTASVRLARVAPEGWDSLLAVAECLHLGPEPVAPAKAALHLHPALAATTSLVLSLAWSQVVLAKSAPGGESA